MPEDRKQHLYLVFDDWNSGYSIRKVSLSRRPANSSEQASSDSEDSEQRLSSVKRLPSEQPALSPVKRLPVFMRVRGRRGCPQYFTSAFGTKIMAMHPVPSHDIRGGVPTIDVQDKTCTLEPLANAPAFPIYIPVSDDRLFHLDFCTFEILRKPEPRGLWVWRPLPFPPIRCRDISYVVRPDQCILLSTKSGPNCGVTFIFDTKKDVWKRYSDWVFPFIGYGHYDPSLKGFVGLSKDGYLHCCTTDSTTTSHRRKGLHHSPDLKCTKMKLYNKNPAEGQHVSATLVHIGKEFCLVECVCTDKMPIALDPKVPPGADRWDFIGGGPQGGRFMYHLKTFTLFHDKKGALKLKNPKVHRYSLPPEARIGSVCKDPVAFWL